MNLQTDNDMKRVLLFFSLMLLLGNIKGLAQSIVIDPAMIGTLVYSHQAQQGVLKDIQSEETKIRNFQILIQQKMSQAKLYCPGQPYRSSEKQLIYKTAK